MGKMAEKEEREARAKLEKLQLEASKEECGQHSEKLKQASKSDASEKGREQIAEGQKAKMKAERSVVSSDLNPSDSVGANQNAVERREGDGEMEKKRQANKMKLEEMKKKFAAPQGKEAETKKQGATIRLEEMKAKLQGRKGAGTLKSTKQEAVNPNVEASTDNGAQWGEPKDWESGSDDDGDDDDGYESYDYDADLRYGQATGSGWP